jgi:hypothetical protein
MIYSYKKLKPPWKNGVGDCKKGERKNEDPNKNCLISMMRKKDAFETIENKSFLPPNSFNNITGRLKENKNDSQIIQNFSPGT